MQKAAECSRNGALERELAHFTHAHLLLAQHHAGDQFGANEATAQALVHSMLGVYAIRRQTEMESIMTEAVKRRGKFGRPKPDRN
jgi:hypothetical protein